MDALAGDALVSDGVLALRPLMVSDAVDHLAGCDDAIVDRLSGGRAADLAEVEAWLRSTHRAWVTGADLVDLGVVEVATGDLSGSGTSELVIRAAPDNIESQRVAERAGFVFSHETDDVNGRLRWYRAGLPPAG